MGLTDYLYPICLFNLLLLYSYVADAFHRETHKMKSWSFERMLLIIITELLHCLTPSQQHQSLCCIVLQILGKQLSITLALKRTIPLQ